jgi:hypothetical protein
MLLMYLGPKILAPGVGTETALLQGKKDSVGTRFGRNPYVHEIYKCEKTNKNPMGNWQTDGSTSMGGKNGKSTDLLACCILRVARKSASRLTLPGYY